MYKTLLTTAIATCLAQSASAVIIWTGGGDATNFYDDANWDFGSSSSSTMVKPSDDDIQITGANINDGSAAFSNIAIGNSFSVTLDSTTYTFTNNNGFTGVDDDTGTNPSSGVTSYLYVNNGSYLSAQFASLGLTINVDSTSEVRMRGTGDSLNSQSETTILNLATGGKLTLATTDGTGLEIDEQIGENNIYVNGVLVTAGNKDTLLSGVDNGNGTSTFTAIPEPSSTALLGLAGLGLIIRRRK